MKRSDARREEDDWIRGLSKREHQVLGALLQGMSNKEIAQALNISPSTVQKHLQRIYRYLGVHTRVEALAKIYRFQGTWG